jgi:hypothetical protein
MQMAVSGKFVQTFTVLFLCLGTIVSVCSAAPASYYVSPDAPVQGNGTISSPFNSLASAFAVTAAPDINTTPDTIFLLPGQYKGSGNFPRLTHSVIIRSSSGFQKTFFQCISPFDSLVISGFDTNVTVEGATFLHCQNAILLEPTAINYLHVVNCVFKNGAFAVVSDYGSTGQLFMSNVLFDGLNSTAIVLQYSFLKAHHLTFTNCSAGMSFLPCIFLK